MFGGWWRGVGKNLTMNCSQPGELLGCLISFSRTLFRQHPWVRWHCSAAVSRTNRGEFRSFVLCSTNVRYWHHMHGTASTLLSSPGRMAAPGRLQGCMASKSQQPPPCQAVEQHRSRTILSEIVQPHEKLYDVVQDSARDCAPRRGGRKAAEASRKSRIQVVQPRADQQPPPCQAVEQHRSRTILSEIVQPHEKLYDVVQDSARDCAPRRDRRLLHQSKKIQ